jgi:predicted dehydrogenase
MRSQQGVSPNSKLNVACVGVGGRGAAAVNAMKGENLVAFCDVDDARAARTFTQYPDVPRFRDFRRMLDQLGKSIDAVTVSTPDHMHFPIAMTAMSLGKHVFVEKPMAHTIEEAHKMAKLAREKKVATQMGNQGHARDGTRVIRELVEAGAIGTVKEIRFWTNRPWWPQGIDRPLERFDAPQTLDWNLWLGPAPERPYHPAYAPFKWRGWWDFGTGTLGDMACHIMDAAFWTLDLGYPTRIEPESAPLFKETAPAGLRITYYFAAKGNRPELKVTWADNSLYPARPAEVGDDAAWPPDTGGGQLWIGSAGKLVAGTYGDDPTLLDAARQADVTAHPPAQKYPRSQGSYAEWIAAAKGGAPAGSAFDTYSGPFTEMVMLGCLAVRMGRTLEVNPATGQITNVQVPAEYITPTYRQGWTLG